MPKFREGVFAEIGGIVKIILTACQLIMFLPTQTKYLEFLFNELNEEGSIENLQESKNSGKIKNVSVFPLTTVNPNVNSQIKLNAKTHNFKLNESPEVNDGKDKNLIKMNFNFSKSLNEVRNQNFKRKVDKNLNIGFLKSFFVIACPGLFKSNLRINYFYAGLKRIYKLLNVVHIMKFVSERKAELECNEMLNHNSR